MTFLDSEIPALLGEPLAALLFTCVGVPHHRTKRAGTPRDPADVSGPLTTDRPGGATSRVFAMPGRL